MNWAEVRDTFLSTVAQNEAANNKKLFFLNAGHKEIAGRLDIEELESETDLAFVQGEDSKTLPATLFAIRHVANATTGNDLRPEPGGLRGRSRFFAADSTQPPQSEPEWYARSQGKLWIRGTADASYTIRVFGKFHPTEITSASWGADPEVPEQYHLAVAWAAAKLFLLANPDVAAKLLDGTLIDRLEKQIDKQLLLDMKTAKQIERFDQRGRFYHRGFRMRRR